MKFFKFNFCKWCTGEVINTTDPLDDFEIKKLILVSNPRYPIGKLWGYRPESYIDKIVVHQELAEGDTISVHNYHISKESHLKPGIGAPKIAYHYTIEKDGTIYLVNSHTDVVWHTRSQNMSGIGIMLCGDFSGYDHPGKSEPTTEQIDSLNKLLDNLTEKLSINKSKVFGHTDFGKPACPGYVTMNSIRKYRG